RQHHTSQTAVGSKIIQSLARAAPFPCAGHWYGLSPRACKDGRKSQYRSGVVLSSLERASNQVTNTTDRTVGGIEAEGPSTESQEAFRTECGRAAAADGWRYPDTTVLRY